MLHSSPFRFLLALLSSTVKAFPSNIWHVSIEKGPAPAPEDGPPLSASAIRDRTYLPIQIGSIIGAYLLFVLIAGSALLLVGRRLRRAAQASPRSLAMQMMKPARVDPSNAYDPSPISPSSNNDPYGPSPVSTLDMKSSWPSPDKSRGSVWKSSLKGHKPQTSIQSSVVTFDESVIEEDKAKNQIEMERLYQTVMEHDEQKSSSVINISEGQQHPPEFQHLRSTSGAPIPPPELRARSPTRTLTTSPRKSTRPSPITTHSRTSSRSSFGSFGKKRGIRNLPISPPMGSPDLAPEHNIMYSEAEPLSPRLYQPGPPPPTPPQRKQTSDYEDRLDSTRLSPKSAEFRQSVRSPRTSIPTLQTYPEYSTPTEQEFGNKAPKTHQREATKGKRTPAPLALRTQVNVAPSQQLPLRSAPLPFRNLNSSRYNPDRPPSTIKATVLESKAPNQHLGPPRTGVPMTPYSPYMPFTPLTPMTPSRLVTKQERKRREKEEGRRVATLEDAVEEEGDMWGDAYP